MATRFGILAWKIPWTEEHGRLHSPQSQGELDITEQLSTQTRTLRSSETSITYLRSQAEPRFVISSVQFGRSVVSDFLWPHESQHARPPCPSPTPGVHPNPYSSSRWCHPTIPSSVVPFSSCSQSFPALGSFPMSQLFAWGGQSIGVSASTSAAAAKSLQSCPTLCDPIDGNPLGSSVPGILQARILEWVAISFSSAWKWKVKVKSLSRARLLATPGTAAYQAPPSMGFSRQE